LYAEGQRRYVESLSAYARQFLQLMEKPDVDLIEGLSPAISIEQKATSHNPRSTVGTVTEIHDYLRLLYARVGTPYCPDHEHPLEAQSVSQMVDAVLALPEDTKLMIMAPVVANRKGEHADLFEEMQAQGFVRFRVQSGTGTAKVYEVDELPKLKKTEKHTIDVVIDRVKVKAEIKQRLAEASRPRCAWPMAAPLRWKWTAARNTCIPTSSPAPSAAIRCRSWSRACSPSTTRWAPARNAMAWATSILRSQAHRRLPEPVAGLGRDQGLGSPQPVLLPDAASLAAFYGFDLDVPFEQLPTRPSKWCCTVRPPDHSVHLCQRARPHGGQGAHLRRRGQQPAAPLPRNRFDGGAEELAKFINEKQCPSCHGAACGWKRAM
jgi:excinuclease ABC subunit A